MVIEVHGEYSDGIGYQSLKDFISSQADYVFEDFYKRLIAYPQT